MTRNILISIVLLFSIMMPQKSATSMPAAAVYYVSSSAGNDSYPGTQAQPFKTIAKINQLQNSLKPGDQVLFKCGDTWRGERLIVTRSGSSGSPIRYSSDPAGCANAPIFSGTQAVGGWSLYSGSIYVADLNGPANSGKFTSAGINQLFRDGKRQLFGRWPNLSASDGGYASVDAQPDPTHLTDNQLPGGTWTGATLHLKVIRWSMVNRTITGQSGQTIGLNTNTLCAFTPNCSGWGYFINNSLLTLDQDGEWYYDKSTQKVYLFSQDHPNNHLVEGSIVPVKSDENLGLINLGAHLSSPISYITIDNFNLTGSYKHGIASPTNLTPDENSYLTLQNNRILDADADGINLFTWVFGSTNDDWRGGNHITIANNVIDGANHFGIHTPSRVTTIEGNTIRNIALIQNLNDSGMGCGMTGSEGTCTEDGAGLRIYASNGGLSGNQFTIRYNRFERIGGAGLMNFGYGHTIQNNFFMETCYAKGDCGAINTFGGDSLASSAVHDITITDNIIIDTIGNTDGTHPNFRALFGFGLYIDQNSRAITATGNTVAGSTSHGILYQNSTGLVNNNTVFNNATGNSWASQVAFTGSALISNFSGNSLVSRVPQSFDLGLGSSGLLSAAANNFYAHSRRNDLIQVGGAGKTLAQWQAMSGKDAGSTAVNGATADAYFLVFNDKLTNRVIDFSSWSTCDRSGSLVSPSLILLPFTSKILYHCGPAPYTVSLPLIKR